MRVSLICHLRYRLLLIAASIAIGACAAKTAAPPAVTAPKYPDFVTPAVPAALGSPEAVARQRDGWQWLQAGDMHSADRNFAAALKVTPGFYPAEAGLGYSALARKDVAGALLALRQGRRGQSSVCVGARRAG